MFTPGYFDGITTADYFREPLKIIDIRKGGLGIPGGVIGGVLALLIYTKVNKISFMEWADYIAPGLLVGQGIGRWGNFINQELYGKPSNLPWAIEIDPNYRYPGFENISHYHPLFLYEFFLNILAAIVLMLIDRFFKKKLYKGDIFLLYLVAYPSIRFGLEFVRLVPSLSKSGVNINQTVMLVVLILAIVTFILRHTILKPKSVEDAIETESDESLTETEMLEEVTKEELEEELDEINQLDAEFFDDVSQFAESSNPGFVKDDAINSKEELEENCKEGIASLDEASKESPSED